MNRIQVLAAALGLFVLAGPVAQACSATDVLDKAKYSRDVNSPERDKYTKARDVVTEMMDKEGIERDVNATEAGTGTLLMVGTSLPQSGSTHDDWRALLDSTSRDLLVGGQTHGLGTDFRGRNAFTLDGPGTVATVREHVRLHIYDGLNLSLELQAGVQFPRWGGIDWYENGTSTSDILNRHLGLTASTPAAAQPIAPTPSTVSSPAAPAPAAISQPASPEPATVDPAPLPQIDHAG